MSKRGRKRKKRILEGHKQVGKRFVPPMKQIPLSTETSYVNDMLPELIWIGLINDRYGYVPGARLLEDVITSAEPFRANGSHSNFAYASNFGSLTAEQQESFVTELKGKEVLELLRSALTPLILLYDEFPLRFLGPPELVSSEADLISTLQDSVGRHVNKLETPGIVLNGSIMLSLLVADRIRIADSIDLPDLNSVIDAPDSDEAKHAAAFMRANALADFGIADLPKKWAKYFWNRGIELTDCVFSSRGTNDN